MWFCLVICHYLWQDSLIGKERTSQPVGGNKMATKTSAVKIEFSFENEVTRKEFIAIEKKVETARNNLPFNSTVNLFSSRFSIEAVITYINSDCSGRDFDKMNSIFTRLINSHKQPATYGWNTISFLDLESSKVGA